MKPFDFYVYKAVVASIYDGDSIRVHVDLGFGNWIHDMALRLYGIDTPEIRGDERPKGLLSKKFVSDRIPVGTDILIRTHKDRTGKYGRYLATVFYGPDRRNLNEELVETGMAQIYE